MRFQRALSRIVCIILLGGGLPLNLSTSTNAEPLVNTNATSYETQKLKLVTGKSTVIDSSVRISRASIASPEIADTVVLTPKQLYVVGKVIGATNLTLWDEKGNVLRIYDVEVFPDLERLRLQLLTLLPEGYDIRVDSSHDFVTVSGKVNSAETAKEILSLAEAYAPKKIINLLQVNEVPTNDVVVDVIKGTAVDKVKF